MAMDRRPIELDRVRRIGAAGFGWIDRRFVRDWVARLTRDEIALYAFLALVADKSGLSYWGDARAAALLKLTPRELADARAGLVSAGLIAYRSPLYQVLEIPPGARDVAREGERGGALSIADVLRRMAAGEET